MMHRLFAQRLAAIALGIGLASGVSSCVSDDEPIQTTGVPAITEATAGNGEVVLAWTLPAGATGYNLYWKTNAGVTTTDNLVASVTSPYTHASLANGTTYYYALTAVGTSGESALSAEVSATPQDAMWTWILGSGAGNAPGIYGAKGVPDAGNLPGARNFGAFWPAPDGSLWLFGGYGYDSAGVLGNLNDLWRFDGSNWTWISGSDTAEAPGVYGTKGSATASNVPGARRNPSFWADSTGNFWLFGGTNNVPGNDIVLNDLWVFDGTNWTWVAGSSGTNAAGTYGTRGVAASGNTPGSRWGGHNWITNDGNLWMFGGKGYDGSGFFGDLNDLWKFNGADWTWVAGSSARNANGTYGTIGVPGTNNAPGGRAAAGTWVAPDSRLWLLGGFGRDSVGSRSPLNDLWVFDGSNWTWVGGSNRVNQPGAYGTQGVAASGNTPGARQVCANWADQAGSLWLFGGSGLDNAGAAGVLSDIWKFDGTYWTWIAGSSYAGETPVFGTKGVPDLGNTPGGNYASFTWLTSNRYLWIFGGAGVGGTNSNDLWRLGPLPR